MNKILLEVNVTRTGELDAARVARLIEDALAYHLETCVEKAEERQLFATSMRIQPATGWTRPYEWHATRD